jgi:hypothetical protein
MGNLCGGAGGKEPGVQRGVRLNKFPPHPHTLKSGDESAMIPNVLVDVSPERRLYGF